MLGGIFGIVRYTQHFYTFIPRFLVEPLSWGSTGLRKFQYLCDESHVCRICYSEYSYGSYRSSFTMPVWKENSFFPANPLLSRAQLETVRSCNDASSSSSGTS